MSTWVNDKVVPSERSLRAIARAFELPVEEVFTAAGYEPEGADARSPSVEEVRRMMLEVRPFLREIGDLLERYDVEEVEPITIAIVGYIPADGLRWAAADRLGTIDVTSGEIEGAHDPFAVIVRGDCLQPIGIFAGDTVILDHAPNRLPRHRELVAVELDGEVTLKRWTVTDDGIELRDGSERVVHRLRGVEQVRILGFYVTYRPTGVR